MKHTTKTQYTVWTMFLLLLLFTLMLLISCSPHYSPYAHDRTAELKTKSLSLMNKADEPFSKHAEKVYGLKFDLQALNEHEQLRKRNGLKQKQWKLLLDPNGHLLYGFFAKWEQDTILHEPFIGLERKLVGEAFDYMLDLEKQLK